MKPFSQQIATDSMGPACKLFTPTRALLILTLATVLAYLNSLNVPLYLDDYNGIVINESLADPADLPMIWDNNKPRFFGALSFSLNTRYWDTFFGFHVVNTLIHIIAAIALFAFTAGLLRTPVLSERQWQGMCLIPLLAALLFVLHPLQTQAVTYIVQRYASLAGMFYLAALATYVWGRLRLDWRLLLLTAILLVLAAFTKENSATLPAAILLVELVFFHRLGLKARGLVIAAGIAALVGLFWLLRFERLDDFLRETDLYTRPEYFFTQMEILWDYIRLYFIPVGLRLEYDYQLVTTPLPLKVYLQTAGHLVVLLIGFALWRKLPLAAFGILFYYLSHVVESSFIPITDIAFEHRTYLPNAGLSIMIGALLAWLVSVSGRPMIVGGLILALLATEGWLTHQRNRDWQDALTFYQKNARLSPNAPRVWDAVGREYYKIEQYAQAQQAFDKAFELRTSGDETLVDAHMLPYSIITLHHLGQHERAFALFEELPLNRMRPGEMSQIHRVRGGVFLSMNRVEQARKELNTSIDLKENAGALAVLGVLELRQRNTAKAFELVNRALELDPEHPLANKLRQRLPMGPRR